MKRSYIQHHPVLFVGSIEKSVECFPLNVGYETTKIASTGRELRIDSLNSCSRSRQIMVNLSSNFTLKTADSPPIQIRPFPFYHGFTINGMTWLYHQVAIDEKGHDIGRGTCLSPANPSFDSSILGSKWIESSLAAFERRFSFFSYAAMQYLIFV